MELKIDLLERERERKKYFSQFSFGIFCFVLAIGWVIAWIISEKGKQFNWLQFGILTLGGTVHVAIYTFERFFGKAHILINSEIISLKASAFGKEQLINWNEVKSIDYNANIIKFKIKKTDDSTMIIDISKFDYALLQEIKKVVDCIAKEKNIQSNF